METTLKPAAASGGRILYMDMLRIVASLAVITRHLFPETDIFLPVYDSLALFCVPVFFMLSGALLLDPARAFSVKRLFTHNIFRIVVAYLVWSSLYAVYEGYTMGYYDGVSRLATFIVRTLEGPYPFWFINALLAQYLLSPIFRLIAAKRRATEYYLVLWIVFDILAGAVLGSGYAPEVVHIGYEEANLQFILGYSGYFLLGYYLAKHEIPRWLRYGIYVLALLFMAVALAMALSGCPPVEKGREYFSLHCLFWTAAIFLAFKQLFTGAKCAPRTASFVALLGKCSFGAYLVHLFVIYILVRGLGFTAACMNPALYVPLATLAVAAISYLASILLSRIPFLSRYIV